MTKNQFIKTLRASLRGLPPAQLDDITADYEEYFSDGLASGRSEEEIAEGLGDPAQIAKELLCEMRIQAWESKKSFGNLGRVVLAVIALGGLNLFLAIPMLVVMALMTTFYLVSGCLILAGLLALLSYIPSLNFLVHVEPDGDGSKITAELGATAADVGQAVADARKSGADAQQHIVIDKAGKHIEINGSNVATTDANGRSVKITKDDTGHVDIQVHDPEKGKDVHITGRDDDKDADDADDDADDADDAADIKDASPGLHIDIGSLVGSNLGVVRGLLALGCLVSGGLLLRFNIWLTRMLVSWFLGYAKLNYSLIKGE